MRASPNATGASARWKLAAGVQVALIGLVALSLYAPALAGELVYDDLVLLGSNPWLGSWTSLVEVFGTHLFGFVEQAQGGAYYRPLMQVLLIAVHQLSGGASWAFHLVSIVFHAATSILVWALARRLLLQGPWREWGSLAAGLVFAVHPVHVEAVAWISGLMDVSTTLFGLAALLAMTRAPLGRRDAIAGASCWLVALLFKEMAVVIPVLLLVWDVSLNARERRRAEFLWRYGSLAVAGMLYAAMRLIAIGGKTTSGAHRILTTGELLRSTPTLIGEYAQLLFAPSELNAYRAFDPPASWLSIPVVLGIAVVLTVGAGVVASWRGERSWGVLLCWMSIPLLPVLYVPALGESVIAERYAYLPSVGFALLLGAMVSWGMSQTARARSLTVVATLVVLGGLTARTAVHIPVWKSDKRLWIASLQDRPGVPIPLYNLGNVYLKEGELKTAIELLEASVARAPGYGPAVSNLSVAYGRAGRFARAVELLEPAVRSDPRNAKYQQNLGMALSKLGRDAEAIGHFRAAMSLDSTSRDPPVYLGRSLMKLGAFDDAVDAFAEAQRRAPGDANIARRLTQARAAAAEGASSRP